jgi:hypothetical protein
MTSRRRATGLMKFLGLTTVAAMLAVACGSGEETTPPPTTEKSAEETAIRVRNFNLGKSINKGISSASGAVEKGFNEVGGAITGGFAEATKETGAVGRTAMSSVVSTAENEWRNASGQIVDAAGVIANLIPTSWPADLGPAVAGQVVSSARSQINAGLTEINKAAASLKGMSAADAERRINGILNPLKVNMPKITIPGIGQAYVPATNPLYIRVRDRHWKSANSVDVMIDLDFFGLKRYRIGIGCIGFPDGFTEAPKVALNGGCDNPWNLLANANLVANAAKGAVNELSRQVQALEPQIIGLVKGIAGDADNPRMIPPLLLDLPLNELLGMCCSLGFPSSKASEAPPSNSDNADVAENSAFTDAIGSMSKDAALAFTVPQLQGITFELSPDLSPVIYLDDTWTTGGKMEFGLELGFFGLFVASVKMGCLTMGTSWSDTPSFTFSGGCDNSWKVTFGAPGYSSSTSRIDARIAPGASGTAGTPAPVVAVPPAAPVATVAAPSTVAQGGAAVKKRIGGVTYMVHTYTLESENAFVVTPEMEGVPIEYLIVAGGGSGASNRTGNKVGVGGGGGGGVLTNLGGQKLFLAAGTYDVIVGQGGTSSYNEGNGFNGGNSSINGAGLVAIGGGGGGRIDAPANNGGSGGGAGYRGGTRNPGTSLEGQGNSGGLGFRGCSGDQCSAGGGGGGRGGAGQNASKNTGGVGGAGSTYNIDGTSRTVAAGGGGGGNSGAAGGAGGGGAGGRQGSIGGDAAANTGSGGGGAGGGGNNNYRGGYGGSGIVIIRYPVSS